MTLWLDDPAGDVEHRFWDGTAWTDKVLVGGEVRESAVQGDFPPPKLSEHERSIRWQVQHEAKMLPAAQGAETLGTARVLVVNHLASYHLPRADYRLMDDRGRLLGRAKRKTAAGPLLWMRVNSPLDHHLRVELEVRDAAETLLGTLDGRRFGSSAAVYVRGPLGEPVGTIALEAGRRGCGCSSATTWSGGWKPPTPPLDGSRSPMRRGRRSGGSRRRRWRWGKVC